MVSGFYRYVRNPMYVGVLVALTGEAILFWNRGHRDRSRAGLSSVSIFSSVLHEEPSLTRRHPEEYPRYKKQCPPLAAALHSWNPERRPKLTRRNLSCLPQCQRER